MDVWMDALVCWCLCALCVHTGALDTDTCQCVNNSGMDWGRRVAKINAGNRGDPSFKSASSVATIRGKRRL